MIDADAHVIENESTWDHMLESERGFKPRMVGASDGDASADYWLIDGRLMPRSNVEKSLPEAARDMSDLSIRIAHMKELNIDLQVIYQRFLFSQPLGGPKSISPFAAAITAGWLISLVKSPSDFAGSWSRLCSIWILSLRN